jgi:hypothetical protein
LSAATAVDLRLDLSPYSKLPWLNNPEKDKRMAGPRGGLMGLMQVRARRAAARQAAAPGLVPRRSWMLSRVARFAGGPA